jgi:CheY-like chemotaxis protein
VAAALAWRRRRQGTAETARTPEPQSPPSRPATIPSAGLAAARVHFLREHVHDSVAGLNNRLSAIALSAEALRRIGLSDAQREQVERVTREVERASMITAALAQRISAGASELPPPAWHVLADAAARPARILVVEADQSNRVVLHRLLRSLGHEVASAANGREAWETLAGATFDCVVYDPRLPGPGGRALYEQVEELLPHLSRRFVFVTGEFTTPAVREFLEETGRPVVGKPYELETLLRAIATILEEVGVVQTPDRASSRE